MDVVVIGAGVVGVSIAVNLAQRGATVTVVDKDWPGAGTTSTSYAWVNANGKEPQSYFELNRAGLEAHHKLAAQGAAWLHIGGHVEFAADSAHQAHLRGRMERLAGRGYDVEEISPGRARDLLPDVIVPEDCNTIAYFPQEAHCYPLQYLSHLLSEADRLGVTVRGRAGVLALEEQGSGATVTLTDGSHLRADTVVSAVGRWSSEVAALAGAWLPMAHFTEPGGVTVGYLLETNPLPVRLDRLVTTPWLNVRPDGGGRLLIQALDLDSTADPSNVPSTKSALSERFLQRLRQVFRNTESATIRRVAVGQRAMPADGLTAVGRAPGRPWLYVVATHSGVTLAPILGDRVAGELLGQDEPMFADYRPSRFRAGEELRSPVSPRKPGEQ